MLGLAPKVLGRSRCQGFFCAVSASRIESFQEHRGSTHRLHSSSLLGFPHRILNKKPPKGTTMEPMGSFWRFRIKFGGFAISTPRTHTRRNPTKTHTSLVEHLPVGCTTFQQISCMGTEFSTARKSRTLLFTTLRAAICSLLQAHNPNQKGTARAARNLNLNPHVELKP